MSNNKIILEGCIKAFKDTNEIELSESETFEVFSLTQIHKDRNITYENIISAIVDGGNDGGIDSLMVFMDEEFVENIDDLENFNFSNKTEAKFILTQCKKENSFKEKAIDKLITTIPVLLDLEKNETELLSRFNSDLVTQALLLIEVWKKTAINGGKISLDYIYTCNAQEITINNVFKQKVDQLIDITKNCLSSQSVTFSSYSCTELLEFYQKQKSNRLSIEFKDRPLSTDFGDNGIGYIGTVKLANYKQFLKSENGDIRDDLFESNIRHFQGLVDVNKKIKSTIENPSCEDFWWLNNGITIIAEEPKEVGKKLSIENIQIVNGLQTSYSIFNNHNEDTSDNRSVLVKVIINNNKETTDHIIASTNSQNPVSATLLRATEPIQRNLELFFLNEGFYYDRRKNYYKNQGKPATKIFSIQLTAQAIQSIAYDDPHTARSRPTSLLKTEASYKKIFNPNKDFNIYLKCCLIYRKGHNFWLKHSDSNEKNKTSNFKLHLGGLLPKVLLSKKNISLNEISTINMDDINEYVFKESISLLNNSIDSYLSENPSSNLINIAKSKEFTDYLYSKVDERYSVCNQ
ncbi:AIPR family protein [Tenacibaculum sp. 1B UA]|uniref:AIPR family protein n=1 Tax=Tenacibaculum sp. 1B UA TaxID=2922252 RepID=UPI002A24A5F3|nr:AIPR family protein [Tenacibaculum sp. 1B UA]MDX8552331.1 AIPR family protein [Tenacibaculum sp. 1B UA]